jgi:hypothetical protein
MIIQAFHHDRAVNDITFTVKRGDLESAREALSQAEQAAAVVHDFFDLQ